MAADPAAGPDFRHAHFGPRPFLHEQDELLSKLQFEHFEVKRLSPVLGAEVHGVHLGRIDEATLTELRLAFLAFKVLFFRDQDITTQEHLAFARHFGELEEHPFLPSGSADEVIEFAKDANTKGVENVWHSDVSWREIPSLGSVLRSRHVPEVGGDTLFADMTAAYRGLSDELRDRIDGLEAEHDFLYTFGAMLDAKTKAEKRKEFPVARHPVVRTHPETGEKILYVNRIFTTRILGVPPEESPQLLDDLCRHADFPEYQCRFRWENDSVAFWDNRAVQHYAASDYWPHKRVMERVTVIGDVPR